MSTIAELEEKVKELLDKIETLKREKKTEEFEYNFEKFESYWMIGSGGDVYKGRWTNHDLDFARYSQGNVFQTKEEAEREVNKRALLTRFKQFRDKCNGEWEPDFEDLSQLKYVCYYDYHEKNLVCFDYFGEANNFNIFGYFKNGKDCERAIELFGKEIKRLFVEE